MVKPLSTSGLAATRLEPDEASSALRGIMKAWELDRFDAAALVGVAGSDLAAIDWTEERRMRVAYLIELDRALIALDPKIGAARWIAAPNRGPFFDGNSPLQMLTGSTREMVELVRQVRRWAAGHS
jgi:hypothetical protein